MMMLFVQGFKKIIIDLIFVYKYFKYFLYFIRFTLFNYGFIFRFKNFISKIYYVYIVSFFYYIIYNLIYKIFDSMYIFNIVNKINKSNYFIYTELTDLVFYKLNTNIKFNFYTIHNFDNIGDFFHKQFKNKYSFTYIYLIYSRLTPEYFDAEIDKDKPIQDQTTSAHYIFDDRYYQIYLYDKFFTLLIPCLINYMKYNLLNWRLIITKYNKYISFFVKYYYYLFYIKFSRYNKIKFHMPIFIIINLVVNFINFFFFSTISLFYAIGKFHNIILYHRFKFTTLYRVPRERLLMQSYLQGFQGHIYLENAAFIKESLMYNVLNLFIKQNFIGLGSFNSYLSSHKSRFPILDYNINSLPINPKVNYYNSFNETRININWRTLFNFPARLQTNRAYLNIASKNYLMPVKNISLFLKCKTIFRKIYVVSTTPILTNIVYIFKFYKKLLNNSIYMYKIQTFIDRFGWFSLIVFLIIALDSFIYIFIYLL